jgi:hypothetical protein
MKKKKAKGGKDARLVMQPGMMRKTSEKLGWVEPPMEKIEAESLTVLERERSRSKSSESWNSSELTQRVGQSIEPTQGSRPDPARAEAA